MYISVKGMEGLFETLEILFRSVSDKCKITRAELEKARQNLTKQEEQNGVLTSERVEFVRAIERLTAQVRFSSFAFPSHYMICVVSIFQNKELSKSIATSESAQAALLQRESDLKSQLQQELKKNFNLSSDAQEKDRILEEKSELLSKLGDDIICGESNKVLYVQANAWTACVLFTPLQILPMGVVVASVHLSVRLSVGLCVSAP